jgi:O-antigen/teichoic acid export membrane protein
MKNSSNLDTAAKRGSVWVLVGYASSQALRLLGNLILWRLVSPSAFGLMAIVNSILQGLAMFSEVGIGPGIIQSKRGDDATFLNTAWTIQVIRGFVLFGVALLLTVPLARFYGAPELVSLVPVCAGATILAGFCSTSVFTTRRQVALGRLTIMENGAQAAGLVLMIVVAYFTRSVWALAIGGLVTVGMKTLLSHLLLPGIRNRFWLDRANAKALLTFGRWVFVSTVGAFLAMQSDRLIFGKLVSLEQLGIYSIAAVWGGIPMAVMAQISYSVILPLLSRVHNEGGDLRRAHHRTRLPWIIAGGWIGACLLAGGPTLIHFLYDSRAQDAGWVLQFLAVGGWFAVLESSNRMALLAMGKPKWMAADSGAKLLGMSVFIPLGFYKWGFQGAVAGFAAADALCYLMSVVGLARRKIVTLRLDLLLTATAVVTAGIGFAAREGARPFVAGLPGRVEFFVEGMVIFFAVSVGWGIVLLLARRSAGNGTPASTAYTKERSEEPSEEPLVSPPPP